ncbi:hypothetical protein GCM10008025_36430 [Ornithinibacillus halotolerans]|uniref:Lon proteolytic domain-containing protein n=2 Tax=Ornithinibacillus halotolerans TaxID=1274357 RepID=A0A916WEI5_9BACI|nr:hypothetical protein GCM10008025_36430 [Ornithinibacillus halotolerans]
MLGLKKDDFAITGENVSEYLGGDTAVIDDFLQREDIDGNSAGLGLALSALVNKLEITNNLDFGVTGAINPSGEVLEVGGIKGKLISSEESEFPYVILPSTNMEEAVEVKEEQGLNIELIPVIHIDEAIRVIKDLNNKKK